MLFISILISIFKSGKIVVYIKEILQIPPLIRHHKTINILYLPLVCRLIIKTYDVKHYSNNKIYIIFFEQDI